jgi:tape measure domain-containing protein
MNQVEFLIKLKDMASGPLQKFGANGMSAFQKLENSISKVAGKWGILKSSIADIDKQLSALQRTRSISLDGSQIKRINREIDQLQSKKDRLEGGGRGGGLGGYLRTGLAVAGIGGLAFLGKDIMQAGMGRQINQIGLETLVGKGPGDVLNNQLINYAKKSIYGNEIMNEGMLMAGSGVKAKNVMPVLSMIGDLATGNAERMKSIALAFSEASSTGYLTGRQELMMRTALFNPLESLSKITGKSGGELKKEMEKGKIGIDLLVKSMEYATGPLGRWYHMQQNIAASGTGKWIAFKGALTTLAGTIGSALTPALGGISDVLNKFINNPSALWGVAAGIGAMTAAWGAYTLVTKGAAIWQGILNVVAFWPLALIGAIAGAITYLCLKYDNWGKSMMTVWSIAKNVATGTYDIFKFAVDDIGTLFHLLGLKIMASFKFIGAMMSNVGRAMSLAAHGHFSDAGQALTAPIKTEAGLRADALSSRYDKQRASHNKTIQDLFNAGQLKGLDFSINRSKGGSIADAMKIGAYTPAGGAGAAGIDASDTTNSITGGGVRNITINVAKFQDKTEIHTVGLKEGMKEVEELIRDMFLRITNSAATAMN